jgi:alpha-glucosidase
MAPMRLAALVLITGLASAVPGAAATLSSPDGHITVRVAVKERLEPYPPGPRIYYAVAVDGRDVLVDSPLGLDFKDAPPFGRGLAIAGETTRAIDSTWETVVGKSARVRDRANELTLSIVESAAPRRRAELVFRAYDDGVAFRWRLPAQKALGAFELAAERTEFRFAANHTAWAAQYGSFTTSQEAEFDRITLSQVRPGSIIGLPLLVKVSDTAWLALSEAGLDDWAGMYLTAVGPAPNALVTTLAPRPDAPGVVVRSRTPREAPWRVIMVGRRPASLIESNLVLNLSEPCALKDTSWITPGRSAWDRWWSGSYAPDAPFKVGMNTESMQYFAQFAADMGWEYVIVDWYWYGDPLAKDADITRPVPEMDVPAFVQWAKARNVKVILWARWNSVQKQMDEAFALYERWGVAGVKIDFMDSDDQEMVNFYTRTLKKAAEHHLAIDFHGAFKPTGLRRTYPNLLTREGVMGNEYNKWSTRVTPTHKVTIPFTRMLAGPMDFTPGGFHQRNRESFVARDSMPFVMGTRASELAELVVYESELAVLCDSPYSYRHSPAGLEFLKAVPASWDETRGLDGAPGEFVVVARRSGHRWFVGAMNGDTARTVAVPLAFAGAGRYRLHAFADGADTPDYPDRVNEIVREVSGTESLTIPMAPGGGFAGWIEPAP